MNGMQIRTDMEAQRVYLTRISLKERSKAFVEDTIQRWIRSARAHFQTVLSSNSTPEASHLLPQVSLRLGMFKMHQDKGEERDSVLAPTFEDMTCNRTIVQFILDKCTIQA